MSKLTQIQQGLKSIGQGEFQELCEAYLRKQGHKDLWAIGSVAGARKTKTGHPDILITMPDGKYILVEATTAQNQLLKKLKGDLSSCLDPKKTGVEIDKIKTIILCFNSDINATEQQSLVGQAQEKGCSLELHGLTKISYALYQDFPDLAKEFLNISVDTGQVLDQDSFVKQYGTNALTTPLNMSFHHRKAELEQMLESLESYNLLLVTGAAGVGKTRLALEALAHYKERHPDTDVKCILSRQQDIYEDTRAYFGQPKKNYLILVDDANRTSRFSYFIYLLQQTEPGRVKVIATVRDYALDNIQQESKQYGEYNTIRIERLSDEELEKFVKEVLHIQNHLYLTRIRDLANGNPRLAVMMAHLAVQKNNLESISDVSSLYDAYFDSIQREVEGMDEDETLKTAALITYFRTVDRTNAQLATFIEVHFGLSQEQFWRSVRKLAEIEVVDLYENDIVKFSDQSLATYFFYLTFFKRKILVLSPFLIELFPATKERLIDALSPCLNAFDFDLIVNVLKPLIEPAWKEMLQRKDGPEQALEFLTVFWFVKPATALSYARSKIQEIKKSISEQTDLDLELIKFEPNSNTHKPPLLRLLGAFSQAAPDDRRMAVQLILDLASCSPTVVPAILDVWIRDFGFRQDSLLNGCDRQLELANELWTRYETTGGDLYGRMLLCVAEHLLRTEHQTTFTRGSSFNLVRFQLPESEDLLRLREELWRQVFSLWENPALNDHVRTTIHTHANSTHVVHQKELIAADAVHVLPFLEKSLDPDRFEDCALLQEYMELVKSQDIPYDKTVEQRFKNRAYRHYEILRPYYMRRERPLPEDYEEIHRKEIEAAFAQYQRHDFKNLFSDTEQIIQYYSHDHTQYGLLQSIFTVLDWLRMKKPDLFVEVIEDYLAAGNGLQLEQQGGAIVRGLIDVRGTAEALSVLRASTAAAKKIWLLIYYDVLKAEEVSPPDTQNLLELYQTTEPGSFPYLNGHMLERHLKNDSRIACKIAEIVLNHAARDSQSARCLRGLLDNSRKFSNSILSLFDGDVNLLKRTYFAVLAVDRSIDYSGNVFDVLLSADRNFANDYVRWIYSQKQYPSNHDDIRDYKFLWQREDTEEVVRGVLRTILEIQPKALFESFALVFFVRKENQGLDTTSRNRQARFMQQEIEHASHDRSYMRLLFEIIAHFDDEEKRQLIATFVHSNQNLDDFLALAFMPRSESWYGSQVPLLQAKIDFFQSLLPIINSVDLLQHRQKVDIHIENLQKDMEKVKREDFQEDIT